MKYLVFLILIFSCHYYESISEYKVNDFQYYEISNNSIENVQNYINKHCRYKYRDDEKIQLPAETLKNGTGVCRDFAILAIDLMYHEYNLTCNYMKIQFNGHEKYHAIIEFNNRYYESIEAKEYYKKEFRVIEVINFFAINKYVFDHNYIDNN
jgi:hypothetical protein